MARVDIKRRRTSPPRGVGGGLLALAFFAAPWLDQALCLTAQRGLMVGKRFPIILSDHPVILAVGVAITIMVLVLSSSRDEAPTRREPSVDLPPAVREAGLLMEDPRYTRALEILGEEIEREADDPMGMAVAHLTSSGIDPKYAQLNLVKLVAMLRAMQERT